MTSENSARRRKSNRAAVKRRDHYLRRIEQARNDRDRLAAATDLLRATLARAEPGQVERAIEDLIRMSDSTEGATA